MPTQMIPLSRQLAQRWAQQDPYGLSVLMGGITNLSSPEGLRRLLLEQGKPYKQELVDALRRIAPIIQQPSIQEGITPAAGFAGTLVKALRKLLFQRSYPQTPTFPFQEPSEFMEL